MNTQRIQYFLSTTALVSAAALPLAPAAWADTDTTSYRIGSNTNGNSHFAGNSEIPTYWGNGFNGADVVVVWDRLQTTSADWNVFHGQANVGPKKVMIAGGATLYSKAEGFGVLALAIGYLTGETTEDPSGSVTFSNGEP